MTRVSRSFVWSLNSVSAGDLQQAAKCAPGETILSDRHPSSIPELGLLSTRRETAQLPMPQLEPDAAAVQPQRTQLQLWLMRFLPTLRPASYRAMCV